MTSSRSLFHQEFARDLLREAELDAVVALSPHEVVHLGGFGTWLDSQVSSWMFDPDRPSTARAGFALVTSTGRSLLATSPLFTSEAMATSSADSVVALPRMRSSVLDDIPALVEALESFGLEGARIGIELDGVPGGFVESVKSSLPGIEVRDASLLLKILRTRKSPEMIARLRTVALDTEAGLSALCSEGTPFSEWRRRFRIVLAERGSDLDHVVYGLPRGGLGLLHEPEGTQGSGFYVDGGARRDHAFSDTGVTFARRPDDPLLLRRYGVARESLLAGAAALVPGADAATVHSAMSAVGGGGSNLLVQGHGLGLDIRELPSIAARRTGTPPHPRVSVDSVINLEVAETFDDGTSIQIEESFLVTTVGAESLIPVERELPWDYSTSSTLSNRKAITHV